MHTYISFLRGVNMTGHNVIKMTELALLYNSLGFIDAKTYIQSGNVIFSTAECLSEHAISEKIEKSIMAKFSYDIPVMIRSVHDLRTILAVNPFLDENNFDPSKMAVMFLHEKAVEEQIRKVENIDYPPDKFSIIGREIYVYCPNGFGRTKLYTNFFENKMGVTGTARNWKTVSTLFQTASAR
jgi:uncharacterized protein (DUF1697 family)